MNVLIACEESQEVCKAFRALGHNAFSCDLQEPSGGHPEWHIQGDVRDVLEFKWHCLWPGTRYRGYLFRTMDGEQHEIEGKWDLLIAHPPCTYMSGAGACRMYPKAGHIDAARYALAMEAKAFFLMLLSADVSRICIENPRPLKCVGLPLESQRIQPYEYGEPWSKLTYLWLKGLPQLVPTKIVEEHIPYVSCGTSRNKGNPTKAGASRSGGAQRVRSRTFPGIAKAMAEQWGGDLYVGD